jgi:hypothetical protein
MKSLWRKLLTDESGVVISSELALVGTVGVLGMVVGLESVTSSVTSELNDLAGAFGAIDQSFNFRSIRKAGHARVAGSGFNDRGDNCDCIEISQSDVGGLSGSSSLVSGGSVQSNVVQGFVAQTSVCSNTPLVDGTVVQERVLEELPVEKCPEDVIIEEHIIRRRVRSDCDTTLRATPKSTIQTLPPKSKPEVEQETIEIKPKNEIKPKKKS